MRHYLTTTLSLLTTLLTLSVNAADYPPNIDYGNKGDFLAKRATEYGRAAIIMPVGPLLVNLPEGPGTTSVTFVDSETGEPTDGVQSWNRARDNVWDLSDLTNPSLFRQLTCDDDTCHPGQPIHAHATVVRFDDELGPLLYGRNSGNLSYHPELKGEDGELNPNDNYWSWGYDPISYLHMTAPYFIRNYWQYNFDGLGQFIIRDSSKFIDAGPVHSWSVEGIPELEELFGPSQLGIWLGEPIVAWDHLGLTGVTGFSSWFGNLLVVASDQQSTGLAIYDVSGYAEGRLPRLLNTFNPQRTEPSGNQVGLGGYWVEGYGTHKMVYAARARDGIDVPQRDYPAIIVVDFLDPENPYVSCEVFFNQDESDESDGDSSSDPMYVNFQDEYAYLDHFQVNLERCEELFDDGQIDETEFAEVVYKFDDIANHCDGSQYFRPLGQTGVFGGYDWWVTDDINEQGMCFFVTDDEADTNAPYVAGHRPLADQTGIPIDTFIHVHIPETLRTESVENSVTVTNLTNNEQIEFRYQLAHTGVISVWPDSYLEANTSYRVEVSGIQDYMGNTMLDYQFEFTTNDGDLLNGVTPGTPVTAPDEPEPDNSPVPSFDLANAYFPVKSSQISCAATDHQEDIWVVNPDNDTVAVIATNYDSTSLTKTHSYQKELQIGYEAPTSVTKVGDLYAVTYRDDDKVVFYDGSGMPSFSVDTGHGTQPVSSVTDGSHLYVALYGSGEVVQIDPSAKTIETRLAVGPYPKAMALQADRLLVTRFISAQQHGEVYDIDTATMSLTRTIVVNKITVPDDIDHGSGVPNYLRSIVIDSAGEFAYVTAKKDNTDRGTRVSNTGNYEALDDDNTVRAIVVTLDLTNHRDANTDPSTRDNAIDLDNVADASGISYLANPAVQVIALQGNNNVIVNNTSANTTNRFTVGGAPQELCSNQRTLYVKNFTDRTLSAIDIAKYLHQGDATPNIETITTVSNESLSQDELAGLQSFYHASVPNMGPEGYMSCASCHDAGGHDGRTWDLSSLGEGLRNTISLNGTSGTRFGNLHWSGNFDEVQDFELQIERLNQGEGLVAGVTFASQTSPLSHDTTGLSIELDQLAAYVNGLGKDKVKRSPYRLYNGELSVSAQRGADVFTEQGCDTCHSGLAFRDGLMHDVGTIKTDSGQRLGESLSSIRTPTLIELWDSAPYFHDGSAATLTDVLTTGSHSVTLTEQQQTDLLRYLMSIDRELYIEDVD